MTHKHRRKFAFALVMCLLFGLLPGVSQAEQTQTPPVADAHAAETPLDAVPATQTPTELTEAETVSLSEDEVRVIKGGTTTLTAEIPEAERGESPLTTASGIVWTSSNPEVATVDSNGVVTGIELGEATITATLNGTVIETYTVYSTLANGLYILEPNRSTTTLAATEISMRDGVALETLPYDHSDLRSIIGDTWYIYYLGNNFYSIHPAFSRGMCLSIFGGSVAALFLPGSINSSCWQWTIESTSNGYILRNRYYNTKTIAPSSSEDYSTIGVETISSSDTSQRWHLGSAIHSPGMLLFDLHTGELVADDFNDSDLDTCSETVDIHIGTGASQTLQDLLFYAQPLDHQSYSPAVSMSFSSNYVTYNSATGELTGNQIGSVYGSIYRIISGAEYMVDIRVHVLESKPVSTYFDSDTMNTTWVEYTLDVVHFLQRAFIEPAGLFYYSVNTPNFYVSNQVSNCTYGYSAICTSICGTSCFQQHHKNLFILTDEIRGSNYTTTYIYWRNSPSELFCSSDSTGCAQLSAGALGAVADFGQNVAFMLQCPETTASKVKAAMSIVATHEVAHTLGLPEAYSNSGHDSATSNFTCVMESYQTSDVCWLYERIWTGAASAFCESCSAKLYNLMNPDSD